jgi:hypothetical protein
MDGMIRSIRKMPRCPGNYFRYFPAGLGAAIDAIHGRAQLAPRHWRDRLFPCIPKVTVAIARRPRML